MKAITNRMFREFHRKPEFERPGRLEHLAGLPDSDIKNMKDLSGIFHSQEYIKSFGEACKRSETEDVEFGGTPVSPETYDLAGYALGASIQAAQLALDNNSGEGGLALARPPGHHATMDMPRGEQGLGFCFFNNSAITALWLAQKGLKVLIYDCDLHHGNGTQQAVKGKENIIFLSTQQEGSWPAPFVSTASSKRNCYNLVFPSGCNDELYLNGNGKRTGVKQILPVIAEGFNPDIVLLSLGADGYHKDFGLLGNAYGPELKGIEIPEGFKLTARTYTEIRDILSKVKRRFAILEGGYNPESVAEVARIFLE